MATDDEVSRQYAPRQFSLAGLLSFVLACGLYFGLLTVSFGSPGGLADIDRVFPWRLIWTIVISWGGLWALYRYWKLKAALAIHYTGPMACGILALLHSCWDNSPRTSEGGAASFLLLAPVRAVHQRAFRLSGRRRHADLSSSQAVVSRPVSAISRFSR